MRNHQPSYHCIANLGDVDPVEHGGKFLCIDRRGAYDPLLIVIEIENNEWKRHDIGLERCHRIFSEESPKTVPGLPRVLAVGDNVYHPYHPAWFGDGKSLDSISSSTGIEREQLIDKLCSSDPFERAWAYIAVADTYGKHNFDEYPFEYASKRTINSFCNKMLKQIANSDKWWDGLNK